MALNEKQLELKLCPIGFELIQDEHPVGMSRSGKNTVFHYCDALGQRASYAGCLHTLDAIAEGRGELRPDCVIAQAQGNCAAINMRKAELKLGRTLFFVDYEELLARRQEQYARDLEESPIQFRRKKRTGAFTATRITPVEGAESEQPVEIKVEPKRSEPVEIQTNIMEQVLKKKVNDEQQS